MSSRISSIFLTIASAIGPAPGIWESTASPAPFAIEPMASFFIMSESMTPLALPDRIPVRSYWPKVDYDFGVVFGRTFVREPPPRDAEAGSEPWQRAVIGLLA